jgi:hypothetical protein
MTWRRYGTTQQDKANNETKHNNATTNQTSGYGKRQRRDNKRQRQCNKRGAEAALPVVEHRKKNNHRSIFVCTYGANLLDSGKRISLRK